MAEPRFGLDDEGFSALGSAVSVLYHNAAWVHALHGFSVLAPSNTGSVRTLVSLACSGGSVRPLHVVSTMSAIPPVRSTDGSGGSDAATTPEKHLTEADIAALVNSSGYNQSKAVGELVCSLAAAAGVPVSIYRPGTIGPAFGSGTFNPRDTFTRVVCALLLDRAAPNTEPGSGLNVAPVDFVAGAIVALSLSPEARASVGGGEPTGSRTAPFGPFNIVCPHGLLPWTVVIEGAAAAGVAIETVGLNEWLHRLELNFTSTAVEAATPRDPPAMTPGVSTPFIHDPRDDGYVSDPDSEDGSDPSTGEDNNTGGGNSSGDASQGADINNSAHDFPADAPTVNRPKIQVFANSLTDRPEAPTPKSRSTTEGVVVEGHPLESLIASMRRGLPTRAHIAPPVMDNTLGGLAAAAEHGTRNVECPELSVDYVTAFVSALLKRRHFGVRV